MTKGNESPANRPGASHLFRESDPFEAQAAIEPPCDWLREAPSLRITSVVAAKAASLPAASLIRCKHTAIFCGIWGHVTVNGRPFAFGAQNAPQNGAQFVDGACFYSPPARRAPGRDLAYPLEPREVPATLIQN
jgi:hypothetical protein